MEKAPAGFIPQSRSVGDEARERVLGAVLGVREMKSALRRRRRIWLMTALVGLVVGAALHVILPRSYKAVSNLYLVEPPGSTPSEAMSDDVSLLRTREVAEQAAALLPGHPNPAGLTSSYLGVAVSDSILSVSAKASSPAGAIALDNAIAKAFLAVRTEELQRETTITVNGLQAEIAQLESSANRASVQISQLQSQVITDQLNLKSTVGGSFVLDQAAVAPVSTKKVTVEDVASGLIAGLGLGLGVVLIGELLSDRPRRRDDVATALGTGVELSLQRRRLRRRGRGTSVSAMIGRRVSARVETAPDHALAVIPVEAETLAASAISDLAVSLSAEGRRVLLVDMAMGRPLAKLHRLKSGTEATHRVDVGGYSFTVLVGPDDPAQIAPRAERPSADVILVLASVDPAFGVDHIAAWATDIVAIVWAGKATRMRLDGIGRMLRRAGLVLRSAILVGGDADDETVGVVDSAEVAAPDDHPIEAISARQW